MDVTKPKITYFEKDVQLSDSLKESILRDIPQEGVEWHRSYGRTAKTVFIEATMVPFSEDYLNDSPEKFQLFDNPLLHTFWMECCDVDVYKASIKDEMSAWINKLQKQSHVDWVIVVVENNDNKKGNKSKLLPRSSVIDRVKADFPQGLKNPSEKCITLSDPSRNDVKSNESYQQFLYRIRSLLSIACSKQLTKYEDYIRKQRENRNSINWNFFKFFVLQEELAFAFEMLGLFDEALVQYDELDALFSQFVINSNLDDAPPWLKCLSEQCNVWHGLCLSKSVYINLRLGIKECKASLLDLRNYLFARQCELLLLQHKPWEVASRSLPFLQNCVNELNTLEINLVEGAVACWVFLSALEILQKCERYSDSAQMETYSRFTVSLWAYARKKLEELGLLAGLMPNMTHTSDCIIKVVALIAGMGQDPHTDAQSPQSRLKEALSKPELFLKQYLEISELTMGTFKHIGHLRSAKLIGKELALLYMKMNKYQKSLPFLLDLEKAYSLEKWPLLLANIRKYLLKCYVQLNDYKKQIRYNCILSATSSFGEEERNHYFGKMLELVQTYEHSEGPVILSMNDIFPVIDLHVTHLEMNSTFQLNVRIESKLCEPITFEKLVATLSFDATKTNKKGKMCNNGNNAQRSKDETSSDVPQLITFTSSVMVGVKCPNITDCLKRSDSHTLLNVDSELQKFVTETFFNLSPVEVIPGINEFCLHFNYSTEKCGIYSISQIYLDWLPNISFVSLALPKQLYFEVISEEPSFKILRPATFDSSELISGVVQRLSLQLNCGSVHFAKDTVLTIKASRNLKMKLETDVDSCLKDEVVVTLQCALKPFDIYTIPLLIFANLLNQRDANVSEHQLSLYYTPEHCNPKVLTAYFHTIPPFMTNLKLHSLNERKIVEILVHGLTSKCYTLTLPSLKILKNNGNAVELKKLRNFENLSVRKDQSAHFAWELLESNIKSTPTLVLFEMEYKSTDDTSTNCFELQRYECDFKLNDYKTQYSIRAVVEAQKGHEFCRVGSLCYLYVTVQRLAGDSSCPSIMYEVVADGSFWNINGRTAGVISNTCEDVFKLTFEILPLSAGFLPLPSIRLSKYVACQKSDTVGVSEAKLVAFEVGQVYNWSRGVQINVLPSSGIIAPE